MSDSEFVLKAESREKIGKSEAMKIRNTMRLPAVIYGPELKENLYITIDYKEFEKAFRALGKHRILTIQIGKKKYPVIIKDYKIHPISRNFLHADFYSFVSKKMFSTEVPINYIGTPIGVKEGGGLYVFTRQLKIYTDIEHLPSAVDVDISSLKTNQYLIVRDIDKVNFKILTHEGTALVEVK